MQLLHHFKLKIKLRAAFLVLLIVIHSVPGLSVFLCAQSIPDTSIIRQVELDQLIITADRTPVMFEQLKRSIQVISRKEIEQLPVRNLAELIGYATNTDVRNRGSFGMQSDVSIRGGSFDQSLILLNGVNISDPQTGHHSMDIPVDLSSINRIEILKGPGARVFGPNAFNGVINIITNEKTPDQLSLSVMGGQYGLNSISATVARTIGNSAHKFQINKSGSDGFTDNTDFRQLNLYYSGTALNQQKLEFQATFMKKEFGANSFYTPKYPEQYEATKTIFVSTRFKTGFRGLSPSVYFRRHYDEFRLFRYEAPAWYKSHNYHYTDVFGSNANLWNRTGTVGKLSVGYDIRHELIRSNKLGDSLSHSIPVPGVSDTYYTLGKSRTSAGLFFEESINIRRFSGSAGLLLNYLSALPGKITLYPGIDIAYKAGQNYRIYGTAGRTLRLPTFTDLYYNDNTSKGDPGLKPEEAINIETGIKYNSQGITAHAAIFKRYGYSMIDWVKLQDQEPWQAMNITRIDITGFETNISLNFEKIATNNSFLKNITVGYSYLKSDKSSGEHMSRYALDILRHKADLLIYHRIWGNLSASWALSFQDRVGGYIGYHNNKPDTFETPYKPFSLLDVQLNFRKERWMVFAEAVNIFNTVTYDYGNVPQAGRWLRAGLKINMVFKQKNG